MDESITSVEKLPNKINVLFFTFVMAFVIFYYNFKRRISRRISTTTKATTTITEPDFLNAHLSTVYSLPFCNQLVSV